tara:strand:- start:1661 stop:2800 length:1140 start_codon:yes stop_codon:yes gene_type:complete
MPCKQCENGKYRFGDGNCKYETLAECEAAHQTYDIVELVIDDSNEAIAIDAISLVTSPAIEVNAVFFNKENNLTLAKIDEEKRMLVSPALIPYKQIYRYNADTDKHYYVYFTADTVRKSAEAFIKHHNTNNATIQHEYKVTGVSVIESWISESETKDKSNLYGYELPKGTWFVSMRIENDEVWQQIKSGELKGLSIEGYFVNAAEKMAKVGSMVVDNMELPLYDNEEEALAVAKEMGCEGVHEHTLDGKTVYMPCADHDIISALAEILDVKKKSKLESYTDYPQAATNNAKRAIEWKEENGTTCGTRVGWTRARQLADRKPISRDTIARMASFKRHQQNKDVPYSEGCGGLMWDAWGGSSGVNWAISKLKEIDSENKTN